MPRLRFGASTIVRWIELLAALLLIAGQAPAQADPCPPVNGFGFICGMQRPEDLALVPGTKWLIASGFRDGSGLKLVDTTDRSMRRWWHGTAEEIGSMHADLAKCEGPPAAEIFNAHGLSLRPAGGNRYRLYVVNHGGRESIEVFEFEAGESAPRPLWVGCVPLPEGLAANAVAAFPDGALLATVLLHPGATLADQVRGRITGGVYQWQPGESGFRLLPGTELPGNNGIETAPDGREFYVIGFGVRTVFIYDRENTRQPVRQIEIPGFMPDNLHWTPVGEGAQLLLAGMMYDEPACGGRRKIINGVADGMRCSRGYMVADLDPRSMTLSIVDYGEPNPVFNGVSSAVIVGDKIWLGSYQADRLAYRPLPASRNVKR